MSLRLAGASSPTERRLFFACASGTTYSLPLDYMDGKFEMSDLADRKCEPCEGGVEPLGEKDAGSLLAELDENWRLVRDGQAIEREFRFAAFSRTMSFVNAVAFVATNEGHHPEVTFSYGFCRVCYWTHAIGGLSDNDFICAAKIDRLAGDN
jgi:4a-hydroxytetrahydrobiopterin dehydratase